MTAAPRQRRRLVVFLALGAVAVAGALAITGYCRAPRIVTWISLRRAREHAVEVSRQPPGALFTFGFRFFQSPPRFRMAFEQAADALASEYSDLFRAGYFDPQFAVEQLPREGFTPGALSLAILFWAYAQAIEDTLDGSPEAASREATPWARALCRNARAKECLVNLLIRDLEIAPGHPEPGGLLKMGLMVALTCRDIDDYGWGEDRMRDLDRTLTLTLGQLSPGDWQAVMKHSRHEREGVRAGSFLLLCHHPDRELYATRAREALRDPSRLVRISAAVALAYHREASGADTLVDGLQHERWEVRWWCAKSLTYFADPGHLEAIQKQRQVEPDQSLRGELKDMERAWNS